MASTFRADYRGIGELLRSPMIEAEMIRRAERVMAAAQAHAPYDPGSRDGTHYRDAFHLAHGSRGGARHDRAYGRVLNDDPAAFYIEVGTRDTPRHHTLLHALDAARY